jgi:hypothetical protein
MSLVDFKKDYFVGSVKKAEEEISVFGISSCVRHLVTDRLENRG